MAEAHAEFFKGFDRAVAFDRRGTADVITHQAMGRCASDEFGRALAEALNDYTGLAYLPSDGGVFTDTANLTKLIPECTNLSVGYDSEHMAAETLDVDHWLALREACLTLAWETLPTERDPSVVEKWDSYGWGQASDYYNVEAMTYKELLAWVRTSSAEDIADTMSDLIDKLFAAEDAAYYNNAAYNQQPQIDDESFPGEWHQ
jgi:hypothetical protein